MQNQPGRVKNIIESLLFVARKPHSAEDLLTVINEIKTEEESTVSAETIAALVEELIVEYQSRGINIVKVAGGALMGTNPANADFVYNLLHTKMQTTLTPQALVTLSIIAYKQPITRAEIERVRGVNSDGPIETLLGKKLIQETGRSEAVGRPILYATTEAFLRHFGLQSLADLPPLPAAEGDEGSIFETVLHEQ